MELNKAKTREEIEQGLQQNPSLISRSALLAFAHNHVAGTIDCNDIARFPAVDAVPREEYDALLKRFRHLLESDFIRSFDEYDRKTGTYKRDIYEADKLATVRHGRWEHLGGDEWCCTVCGEVIHTEGSWEKPTKNTVMNAAQRWMRRWRAYRRKRNDMPI